jgi:hypothetical protein
MQAKLWLLRYTTHLRVVISSANMFPIDWNAMTENFWFQDFPLAINKQGGSFHFFNVSQFFKNHHKLEIWIGWMSERFHSFLNWN